MAWQHFSIDEFKCPCCGGNKIEPDFVDLLDKIRARAGVPFKITSGYRCPTYNTTLGGGPEHPKGQAADIACPSSLHRWKMLEAAFHYGVRRIGVGKDFVHLGKEYTLPNPVAWDYYK